MAISKMTEAMVADGNRDSVSSDLRADLSGGHLHTFHDRHMRDSSGSRKDAGVSQRQTRISKSKRVLGFSIGLTLTNVVTVAKRKTISIGTSKRGMGDNRSHGTERRVVDEGSGGSQDLGGSSQDKGISIGRPLAKVMSSKPMAISKITEAMVADGNWDSVSSDLRADLSRGDL